MEYGFTRPQEASEDPLYMIRGSELHLARELEIEKDEVVVIDIESEEDMLAIKLLKLYEYLINIHELKICREVPIFGWIGDLFLMGKIDELRWKEDDNSIELSEFKTRTKLVLPGKAQQDTHKLQIMIYQYLMTKLEGIDVDTFCDTVHLSKDKQFSSGVLEHCPDQVVCLGDLLDLIKQAALVPDLNVKTLIIEYSGQEKDAVFAKIQVEYNEDWLLKNVLKCQEYWLGQRFAQGVDIEDAWKCSLCTFADNCDWRRAKVRELMQQNVK